jgi:hypothetical protein
MGLKNSNGNYLKILSIDDSYLGRKSEIVSWEIWVSQDVRNIPTNFDKPQNGNTRLDTLQDKLDLVADVTQSIKNNRIIAAYSALKENSEFSSWEDC